MPQHKTDAVYEYVRLHQHQKVYATIGRDGQRAIYTPGIHPARSKGRRAEKCRVPLYIVGVDSAKANWMSALLAETPGPGFVHLPHHPAIEEEVEQLVSERQVKRRGLWRWEKIRPTTRNEALDAAVLALWALRAFAGGGTTDVLLAAKAQRMQKAPTAAAAPSGPPAPARQPWLGRHQGWLRR